MNTDEQKSYRDLEYLAALMDDKFSIFGFRFGLSFIIDLIPEIGDIITSIIALYILFAALKYKISKFAIFRMLLNIAIYFLIGLIPWLGDLFGAWFKPNRRNMTIMQEQLGMKAR